MMHLIFIKVSNSTNETASTKDKGADEINLITYIDLNRQGMYAFQKLFYIFHNECMDIIF